MRISIVTVVLNRVNTISNSLESLREQTYADWEHIIQDGGSTDGTLDVIKQFTDTRMKTFSEPDKGIYDALNKGISVTTGDIIGMLHSDDKFAHNHVLEKISEFFKKNEDIDGVFGDLDYVFSFENGIVFRKWVSGQFKKSKLKYGWMPPHPTVFLRQSVFERYGMYDASFRISGDYDALLRYMKNEVKFGYLNDTLVLMKVGGASNGSINQFYTKTKEDIRALRKNEVGSLLTILIKNIRKIIQFRFKKMH